MIENKSQFCKGHVGLTGDTPGFPTGAQVFFKCNAEIFLHSHTLQSRTLLRCEEPDHKVILVANADKRGNSFSSVLKCNSEVH